MIFFKIPKLVEKIIKGTNTRRITWFKSAKDSVNISEEEKWSFFSPQYVRNCLVDVLFSAEYSIDEIIYQTGIDVKNIHRYISNEDIIERQMNNPKGLVKKKLFDGLLEVAIEDWK
ncbi:MAG: hypothetical protein K0R92_501 [Lachnospiraceae bacterium]|nr:hypothetical protein [Lachnospiraceae bacterium]